MTRRLIPDVDTCQVSQLIVSTSWVLCSCSGLFLNCIWQDSLAVSVVIDVKNLCLIAIVRSETVRSCLELLFCRAKLDDVYEPFLSVLARGTVPTSFVCIASPCVILIFHGKFVLAATPFSLW